jgi:hypothetical protein
MVQQPALLKVSPGSRPALKRGRMKVSLPHDCGSLAFVRLVPKAVVRCLLVST